SHSAPLKSEAGVNNGLIFLLYAQPPVWRACPTLDKIVAAHDLSMFVRRIVNPAEALSSPESH
ncbi:MAG: hypothetical protein ACK5Q7_11260, partial [Cyanobacteriota bacterium]